MELDDDGKREHHGKPHPEHHPDVEGRGYAYNYKENDTGDIVALLSAAIWVAHMDNDPLEIHRIIGYLDKHKKVYRC